MTAEIEEQIQEESKMGQEMVSTQSDLSGIDRMEIKNTLEQDSKILKGNLLFSFEALHPSSIE